MVEAGTSECFTRIGHIVVVRPHRVPFDLTNQIGNNAGSFRFDALQPTQPVARRPARSIAGNASCRPKIALEIRFVHGTIMTMPVVLLVGLL